MDGIMLARTWNTVESRERAPLMLHGIRFAPPISHFCSSGHCEAVQGRARTSITLNRVLPWVSEYCRDHVCDQFGIYLTVLLETVWQNWVWPKFWTPKNIVVHAPQILGIPFKYKIYSIPYCRIYYPQNFQSWDRLLGTNVALEFGVVSSSLERRLYCLAWARPSNGLHFVSNRSSSGWKGSRTSLVCVVLGAPQH